MAKKKTTARKRAAPSRLRVVRKKERRKPAAIRPADDDLVVVGVGASAGGLEAFSQLLSALPRDPGFAIVLVQHLAPHHESALRILLSGRTNLDVVEAADGMLLERDRVYVTPPNVQIAIRDHRLALTPRPTDRSQYTPVDHFLTALGTALRDRAMAVILSGTASDGTIGVRKVKAAGGFTIAQDPETAKYDGMPRAAIATGLVDLVLSPAEIGRKLVELARHPLWMTARIVPSKPTDEQLPPLAEEHLEEIFALIRTATGVDFRRYKLPTLQRRIVRRMALQRVGDAAQYLKLLRTDPAEVRALYQDILIHVTRFFREPESFAAIAERALPKILANRGSEVPIRIWVPGCSTGEEAYSIAILLLETLGERAGTIPVQVFGTDVSESAIEHARAGLYGEGIAGDVSADRLRRFFTRVDGAYRVNKTVRDMCVFARQDLTRDPPFSRLDLILCRNVLIYLGGELQNRLMHVFHYALRPSGFLVLGAAETVGMKVELFATADKKSRIYQKQTGASDTPVTLEYTGPKLERHDAVPRRDDTKNIQGEASRLIEERYAPPGLIVDGNFQVCQFRGQTGAFLEPAPGDPSLSVLKMAREGLLHGLRGALQEARKTRAAVRRTGLKVRGHGGWQPVDVEVHPLRTAEQPHFLILFEQPTARAGKKPSRAVEPPRETAGRSRQETARLRAELASSREYLQSIIQELEAANEELQSANEEVLSANEELQSTNEELDTAKEELQSTNEELNTLNEELHARNEELGRVNSDLSNLLSSVQIAIVMVAADMRIRRFTPMAERLLNLRAGDIGRPIGHIKPNLDCPDLEGLIAHVVEGVEPVEREVRDRTGGWYSLRIRPYKSLDNRIDGAVLALLDVRSIREHEEELHHARDYAEAIVQTVREPLVVLDAALRVKTVNKAFTDAFAVDLADTEGRLIYELGDGQWNIRGLRTRLQDVLRTESRFEGYEVDHEFPSVGRKTMVLNARRIDGANGREPLILLAIEDASNRPRKAGSKPAR